MGDILLAGDRLPQDGPDDAILRARFALHRDQGHAIRVGKTNPSIATIIRYGWRSPSSPLAASGSRLTP
ncbi:hypothetical protein [Spirulina sp.]|uniref:hypothetical protein n=1 Tax=Spirulina sp. TaxID=1157 RepID=UPI003F729CB1